MILTYGNTKGDLAPYVDSGKCATDPSVLSTTNSAMMRLLMVDNWKLAVQKITFKVTHNSIVLPEFVDSIVKFRTGCGQPSRVFDKYYEFSESGPGQTTWNGNPGNDLVDLGIFPTFYEIDINASLTLAAFSTNAADVQKSLHIRGQSAGRDAMTNETEGIILPINRWKNGVEGIIDYDTIQTSSITFKEVTHVVKQLTSSNITLLAFDRTTKQMQILAVYQTHETTPGYRRYKIVNHDHENGTTIVAACKMRYVPMRTDNDPLIIQNLPAIIAMVQALREEKSRNINAQQAYEATAMQWLQRQSVMLDDHQPLLSVQMTDWGMADSVNFQ